MTNNNALKKQVREHAARTGVPYAQARREVIAMHEATGERVGKPFETTQVTWVQIQQAVRDDDSTPLPLTIDQNGYVGNQDFWRGDPWRLIGFTADPDEHVIDLQREEFLAEPGRAVGMHPVFMDRKRAWSTWKGAVETVEAVKMTASDPREIRAEFLGRTPTGEQSLSIGVGHILKVLKGPEIAGLRGAAPRPSAAADDLLSALCMTGDKQALEFSAMFDDVEDEDMRLLVALDYDDVDAWVAAGRGYQRGW
jgi:hypothetical protein